MRLRELDLVRYGKFTERRLDFGPAASGKPDLHIVYGPNEAGKSTLFSGFLDLLFGIEHYSSYGFLHPYPTMRVGGVVEAAGRTHHAFRVKRKTNTLVGADDQPLPDNLFSASLGSIDRATYRMMFSLDDDSIEQGGESILKSEGELGSLLFSASSGLPDSAAILASLRGEADAFYRPQARKHQLSELKAELDALKVERSRLDVNAREYAALRKTLLAARERHDAAMARRVELRMERDRLKAQMDALPLFRRFDGLRADLAKAPALPRAPAEWAADLPALRRRDIEIATRLRQLDDEARRRQDELDDLPRDEAALVLMERLNVLQETALDARYVTAARDMPARIDELSRTKPKLPPALSGLENPATGIRRRCCCRRPQTPGCRNSPGSIRPCRSVRHRPDRRRMRQGVRSGRRPASWCGYRPKAAQVPIRPYLSSVFGACGRTIVVCACMPQDGARALGCRACR